MHSVRLQKTIYCYCFSNTNPVTAVFAVPVDGDYLVTTCGPYLFSHVVLTQCTGMPYDYLLTLNTEPCVLGPQSALHAHPTRYSRYKRVILARYSRYA